MVFERKKAAARCRSARRWREDESLKQVQGPIRVDAWGSLLFKDDERVHPDLRDRYFKRTIC